MNTRSTTTAWRLLAACAIATTCAAAAAASPRYHLVDLGAYTNVYRIDAQGHVAGFTDDGKQAAVWSDGTWHPLGAQSDDGAFSSAIDVRGGATYTVFGNGAYVASYLARRGGGAVAILPDSGQDVWVWDVSRDGEVAGNTGGMTARCFVWHDGVTRYMNSTGDQCNAQAINDSRQVAGSMNTTPGGDMQAFLWQDGRFTMLGNLGGTFTVANDINQAGHVAVASTTATGASRAALYADGQLIDLGAPPGATDLAAVGLNDRDVVVGRWFDTHGEHPFLAHGTQMVDLLPLIDDTQGLDLWGAIGINNAGVIIGNAVHKGVRHGYVLTPIE
jgi:probable HAF family extracellular repeat protein